MRPWFPAVLAALILAPMAAARAGVPMSNAQVWTEADVTVPLSSSLSATTLGVVRDGESLPGPTLAGGGVTVDARAGAWTFTVGDLWVAARSAASGQTVDVDVPLAAITYGWTLAGISFSERNRIEHLDGAPGDPWRYRNQVAVRRPVTGLGPIAAVFASYEVFYDFGRQKWSRNRALAGIVLPVGRRSQVQVYYVRQDDRFSRPGAINALGLAYRLDFR